MKDKIVKKSKRNIAKNKVALKRKKESITEDEGTKKKIKKKDYSEMNLDEFLDKEIDRESDDDLETKSNKSNKSEDNSDSDEDGLDYASHKASLAKLKDIDPEFYKFLKQNDKKLLQFKDSDSEGDEDEQEEQIHKPNENLEVASDESDFEIDDDTVKSDDRVITLKLLKTWQTDIQSDKSTKTINCLIKAFHAALIRVSSDEEDAEYKVDGSAIFNAVIQLCILELEPALRRYLKIPQGSKQPITKSKRCVKIKGILRGYFQDLLKLLGGVSSTNIRNVLLKHLHYMTPYLLCYTNITRKMLKKLILLWATGEESVRVVAFMVILRITNNNQAEYLSFVLKSMYMTYVRNCKFMSINTLPEINFMRRSLTEMFTLDVNVSYQHVFLYIRQLAIHLRNAITIHKTENMKAVLNWQFINSIHLWANLLTITINKPQLQPLVYPLVQITLGVIKLIPTAQYYPLRFHCLHILIELSRDTEIFIPILPFLVEVLTGFDFNKKHKKVSMKPLQFICVLRIPKSQMIENGFKDAIIESVYSLLLEYLTNQSHTISFPDLTLFCVMQIKQFLKKCNNFNYTKKFKQLIEKIDQNTKFIENERKKVNFNIYELKKIEAWEAQIKNKGTPLSIFFDNWMKITGVKKRKQATKNDELADYTLPTLKKVNTIKKKADGPVELFPSDSEDDTNNLFDEMSQERENEIEEKSEDDERSEENTNNIDANITENDDNEEEDKVEDINISDW